MRAGRLEFHVPKDQHRRGQRKAKHLFRLFTSLPSLHSLSHNSPTLFVVVAPKIPHPDLACLLISTPIHTAFASCPLHSTPLHSTPLHSFIHSRPCCPCFYFDWSPCVHFARLTHKQILSSIQNHPLPPIPTPLKHNTRSCLCC
jgi:hypothetical protein